jgi:hypothetical protein
VLSPPPDTRKAGIALSGLENGLAAVFWNVVFYIQNRTFGLVLRDV